jgi:hypothetical protein
MNTTLKNLIGVGLLFIIALILLPFFGTCVGCLYIVGSSARSHGEPNVTLPDNSPGYVPPIPAAAVETPVAVEPPALHTCQVTIDRFGMSLDNDAVEVGGVVNRCQDGVRMFITGDASHGEVTRLRKALRREHIEILSTGVASAR